MRYSSALQVSLDEAIAELITSYHSLNSSQIQELDEEPSPLEFMRYVSANRPFVIRKGAADWKASQKWNVDYLTSVLGDQLVKVAVTPHGNADAMVELEDDNLLFVKPFYTEESFSKMIKTLQQQELQTSQTDPIRYAQTQNDNLRDEYSVLFPDVLKDIPFARIALQREPEAINFWLGNSQSTTALHKDNYENMYVQIRGQKHFVLLPPVEAACVNEKPLLAASYVPRAENSSCSDTATEESHRTCDEDCLQDLVIRIDEPTETVPTATWDPDSPTVRCTPFSNLSTPIRVTLNEGDMLYLPALWYHKVSQSCSDEGICCAVNYWYDMDFGGEFYPLCSFARNVGLLSLDRYPRPGMQAKYTVVSDV